MGRKRHSVLPFISVLPIPVREPLLRVPLLGGKHIWPAEKREEDLEETERVERLGESTTSGRGGRS